MTTKQRPKSKVRPRAAKSKAASAKSPLTPDEIAAIATWIKSNDKRLYGARATLTEARQRCLDELRPPEERHKRYTRRQLSEQATAHCTYWRNVEWSGRSKPSKTQLLTAHQWEKLQDYLRWLYSDDNDLGFDPRTDNAVTIDFIVRVCRLRGQVKASRLILLNCSVFQRLNKGRVIR